MAKVFTITEGLENLGALKTGGQGSVYKGRRKSEIITAIKLLPTPIYSESENDKNFVAFQNEVQKLKKVNEEPNPNVVKILSYGITDSGNFPYIEMEYIEGPDLEELLKPPHEPVFTIDEALKVATDISSALAHCHKIAVKHGDIKSNNVKYNEHTDNYVLLDFGLSLMSDEQRRTSIRHAGAVEFMAPEQNEGEMRFETDVYSFGIILFELLAGQVPFPLNDKGETARNKVMVAHIEVVPPEVLSLRRQSLPQTWSEQKKKEEMEVPDWLIGVMYKCLEKKPGDRFKNGIVLYQTILEHAAQKANNLRSGNDSVTVLQLENKRLRLEKEQLQQQLLQYQLSNPGTTSDKKHLPGITSSELIIKNNDEEKRIKKIPFLKKLIILSSIIIIVSGTAFYFFAMNKDNSNEAVPQATAIPENKTIASPAESQDAEITGQLQNAKDFFNNGKAVEALIIYNSLAKQGAPEAMYEYGKLALQNKNANITCQEAFELIKKAGDKEYIPAKRTLGFLYCFADDKASLQQNNYYERCVYIPNLLKGTKLLMEAMLKGDTAAGRLLDELNSKQLKEK